MQIFDSITNQASGHTTVAVATLAHAGHLGKLAFGAWQLAEKDSRVAFGYPTVFSVSRSNPDPSLLAAVANLEGPLGVECLDVSISNCSCADGVYHNEIFGVQNQLWTKPNQPSQNCNAERNWQIDQQIFTLCRVTNGLKQKQGIEQKGYRTPNKIAFWSVGQSSIHKSIFAVESLDRKNQTK